MQAARYPWIRFAGTVVAVAALGIHAADGAKGGKPGKPDDPDPPPGESQRYSVTVEETVFPPVFWNPGEPVLGRITGPGEDQMIVNAGTLGGINPYLFLQNLQASADPGLCASAGDWSVCFPDIEEGSVLISESEPPTLQFSCTAFSRTGKNLWYMLVIDGLFAGATTDSEVWDLYALPEGESMSMVLTTWTMGPGNGPLSKGCLGCGDLVGNVTVTVTRVPITE